MTAPILRELAHHEYLRERLAADFPEVDEETLRDTLEGLTDLDEMLAAVTASYLDDRALVAALKLRLAEMQARLGRLDATADNKRRLIARVMERAELPKLTRPEFTLSWRRGAPALVVEDESRIPEDYWKPQPPRLDRQGLLAELRSGCRVAGVALSNGAASISVRTK